MFYTKDDIDKLRADLDSLKNALIQTHQLLATLLNRHDDLENFLNKLRKECT